MILVTGKSALSEHISQRFDDVIVVGKPEYDFSKQQDCDKLLNDFPNPDIIINTFAKNLSNSWNTLTTNYVATVYLTVEYYKQLSHGQIINISSMSSWWPSYPGMPFEKFYYGISKLNLSDFGKNFNRIIVDDVKDVIISTIEPGRFKSPMSNYSGTEVKKIVDLIEFAIINQVTHLSLVSK